MIGPSGCTRSPIRLEDALLELAHVHELEQARLLRAASFLRIRRDRGRRGPELPPPRARRELEGCGSAEAWRAAAIEEVRMARADDAPVDSSLLDLIRSPIGSWRRASWIAAAAQELAACPEGVLAVARADLAECKLELALENLLELLDEDPIEDLRLSILETVATGLESAGDFEGSLAFQEAALNCTQSDLRQAVPLLALALSTGDEARARLASNRLHRLDLGVPGIRSRFDAALTVVRKCSASDARRRAPSSIGRDDRIREFLRKNLGPEAEVARLVLQG